MPIINRSIPEFSVQAFHNGEFKTVTHEDVKGKWSIFLFYPADFTFVCPSEIIAFDHRYQDFKSKGIEVIGVSCDSEFTHLAWKNTPVNAGGIGKVQFPLVSDITKDIARSFDVLFGNAVALRGSFLLDKDGTVRHAVINDLPLGRNIDEMLRMVDTMLFTNEHGEVCPAGWHKGDAGMKADPKGVADYLGKNASKL